MPKKELRKQASELLKEIEKKITKETGKAKKEFSIMQKRRIKERKK